MSRHEDQDDQMFNEYLERGSALSTKYKQSSNDEVPASLDQKILSQAHEAISNKKIVTHPSWWTKWNKPLALAATLLLAITVIYRVGDRSIDKLASSEPAVMTKPSVEDKASSVAARTSSEESASTSGTASTLAQLEAKQSDKAAPPAAPPNISVPSLKQVAPLPVPQSSFAAPMATPASNAVINNSADAPAKGESEKDKAASGVLAKSVEVSKEKSATDTIAAEDIGRFPDARVAESLQRIPGIATPTNEPSAATARNERSTNNAEQRLQTIRDLRKQGKDKEALKAWKQFRKDFPTYPVAEDDLARQDKH